MLREREREGERERETEREPEELARKRLERCLAPLLLTNLGHQLPLRGQKQRQERVGGEGRCVQIEIYGGGILEGESAYL